MFQAGDAVLVGVSGGADSMALLHLLTHSSIPVKVTAAHFNHQLRGEESLRDQRFVQDYCQKNGIPLLIGSADVKSQAMACHQSEELCGRELRYQFFQQHATQWIATAHTLSDRIETFLFYLARGSSLEGLCSIPQIRENIVRPLLHLTREEIETYCRQHQIPFVQDSSNRSLKYTRNKIRLQVLPQLKEINPQLEQHCAQLFAQLEQDSAYLIQQAESEFQRRLLPGKMLDLHGWKDLPLSIASRTLKRFCQFHQIVYDYPMLQQLQSICRRGNGRVSLPKEEFAQAQHSVLRRIASVSEGEWEETEFSKIDNIYYAGFHLFVGGHEEYEKIQNVNKNFFLSIMDYDRIFGNVKIRHRQTNDSIRLPKRPTKTLKKLMIEQKIPWEKRDHLAVFADDNGVFLAENVGCDQRVAPNPQTERYLFAIKGVTDETGHFESFADRRGDSGESGRNRSDDQ